MSSNEVHLHNGSLFSFVIGAFKDLTSKPNLTTFLRELRDRQGVKAVCGTHRRDLGTDCGRKTLMGKQEEDIFQRGVIASVFQNAQRGDTSLVNSLLIERRGENGGMGEQCLTSIQNTQRDEKKTKQTLW